MAKRNNNSTPKNTEQKTPSIETEARVPQLLEAQVPAPEVVEWEGETFSTADDTAARDFIERAIKLWRNGRKAIHLALAVAVYHAQQHGRADLVQRVYDEMDSKREKALRAGIRRFVRTCATAKGDPVIDNETGEPITDADGKPVTMDDRTWMVFSSDKFSVKKGSIGYRKDNLSLQQMVDVDPFYVKIESTDPETTFSLFDLLKILKAGGTRTTNASEEHGIELPGKLKAMVPEMMAIAEAEMEALASATRH